MVLHKKLTEGDMTLTRQPHFIINKRQNKDDSKTFFQNAIQKTKWFIETLEQQSTNHPSYEELLLFEKDTNMLFLLEASIFMAAANNNSNQYKYSPDKLKILASFILINDLNIRSYLDAAYYSGVDLLVELEKRDSYNYFFLLNFILVPFLTKFIKKELSSLVPRAFTGASESEDHTLSPILRGKLAKLYKKDFLYRLVKNP
ncbi:hypothetical protein [Paenibacillus sp. UASWS1643]|uniref:hypothetical protein n=1 Tax=Paenibacillus sp. UASWS1643 TaxID=2580422 RepID=UPI00123C36F0|nr:hypothetical protein [Paenibacillus sp. UASWS1643]KAA8747236.1 hypothetical protein FE296_23970 [Paenibacillus sp. UASWS1643]